MALSGSPELSRRRPPSSRLHGFTFSSVGWGRHRLLRCLKLPGRAQEDYDEEIRVVGAQLVEHYHAAVEKIDRAAKAAADVTEEKEKAPIAGEEKASPSKPWSLRTRRAVCGAPGGCLPPTPAPAAEVEEKKMGEGKRRKFSLTLRKEEVEEDLRALFGEKFSRRKRRKQSQKAKNLLDRIFPGACLIEISADTYKVT